MSNFERRYGRGGFGRSGYRGAYIQPGQVQTKEPVNFASFAQGYDSRDSREDVSPDSSPFMIDVEVSKNDRLIRAPGTTEPELQANAVEALQLHASLEHRSELLLLAPPFVGIMEAGVPVWHDAGLNAESEYPWISTNYGGTLFFSRGRGTVYSREPGQAGVTAESAVPLSEAYAVFAARLFVGGAILDGNYEPLGIGWSAANSNPRDFLGLGAGYELLIDDMSQGDRIVALRTMGLDFMAIICRSSIWIARRTGLRDRPADFQPRVPGIGAVSPKTCTTTRFGVVFLSDTGLYIFDGNEAHLISAQINADLLPLSMAQLLEYKTSYNPFSKRLYLHTPTDTWVYDLVYKRWYRRSMVARDSVVFPEQFDSVSWGELVGTWADQEPDTWRDFAAPQGQPRFFFLSSDGMNLAQESYSSELAFGSTFLPAWEFRLAQGDRFDRLFTTDTLLVDYAGSGTLRALMPDMNSQYVEVAEFSLELSPTPRLVRVPFMHTGRGYGLRIEMVSGSPQLLKAAMMVLPRTQRLEALTGGGAGAVRTLSLLSTGLLFKDTFDRPPGPVGVNYESVAVGSTALDASITADQQMQINNADGGTITHVYVSQQALTTGLLPTTAVMESLMTCFASLDGLARVYYRFRDILGHHITFTFLWQPGPSEFAEIHYDSAIETALGPVSIDPFPFDVQRHWKVSYVDGIARFWNHRDPASPNSVEIMDWSEAGKSLVNFRFGWFNHAWVGVRHDDLRVYKNHTIRCNGAQAGESMEVLDAADNVVASSFSAETVINVDIKHLSVPYAGFKSVRLKDSGGNIIGSLEPEGGVWGGDVYSFS